MRFGLLLGHQLPRPWGPGAEAEMFAEALELVGVADRVGLDRAWVLEHHFLEEFSHSSAPAVFLGAASQRTSRIRLGLASTPLASAFGPVARIAEAVATLDLLSSGRVDVGTAEAVTGAELGGFGVDRGTRHAQWEELLAVLARMLAEEPFAGVDGRFATVPPRMVLPRPQQHPHPPLWLACGRPAAIRTAAEHGLGALCLAPLEPEEAAAWVTEYRDTVASERCVPAGQALDARVAVTVPLHVHADEETAIERGIDGAHFWYYAQAHYETFGDHRPGRTDVWEEFGRRRAGAGLAREAVRADGAALRMRVLDGGAGALRGAIGTPEQVAELVEAYAAAGVDEVVWVLQAGRTAHPHAVEALELFARDVLPAFAADAAIVDGRHRSQLAPAIDAALARRAPARPLDAAYAFGPRDEAATVPRALGDRIDRPGAPALRRSRPGLRRTALTRGESAFRTWVKRSDDEQLERTAGSPQGLRVLFLAMQSSFVPAAAGGFTGELAYELRGLDGTPRYWTLTIGPDRARARPGRASAPRLTVKLTLADFVRVAGGDLDAGTALLTGRMDLEGDLALATRLGAMFGQSGR